MWGGSVLTGEELPTNSTELNHVGSPSFALVFRHESISWSIRHEPFHALPPGSTPESHCMVSVSSSIGSSEVCYWTAVEPELSWHMLSVLTTPSASLVVSVPMRLLLTSCRREPEPGGPVVIWTSRGWRLVSTSRDTYQTGEVEMRSTRLCWRGGKPVLEMMSQMDTTCAHLSLRSFQLHMWLRTVRTVV